MKNEWCTCVDDELQHVTRHQRRRRHWRPCTHRGVREGLMNAYRPTRAVKDTVYEEGHPAGRKRGVGSADRSAGAGRPPLTLMAPPAVSDSVVL